MNTFHRHPIRHASVFELQTPNQRRARSCSLIVQSERCLCWMPWDSLMKFQIRRTRIATYREELSRCSYNPNLGSKHTRSRLQLLSDRPMPLLTRKWENFSKEHPFLGKYERTAKHPRANYQYRGRNMVGRSHEGRFLVIPCSNAIDLRSLLQHLAVDDPESPRLFIFL